MSFIEDGTISGPMSDAKPLPAGANPDIIPNLRAARWNEMRQDLLDLRAHSSGWVNVRSYGADGAALANAAAAASTAGAGLLIAHPITITTAVGVISVPVRFEGGGKLILNTGGAVTLSGALDAPLTRIFDTSGGGTLTFSAKVTAVYARWWAQEDGSSDDTAAVQAALDAAGSRQGTLYLSGFSRITSALVPPQNVTIVGLGPKFGAGIVADATQAFRILGAERAGGWAFRVHMRDLTIMPVNTPASTKVVEVDDAYDVQFEYVWLFDLANNGSIGFDITDSNDIGLNRVSVYGPVDENGTPIGVRANGTSTVRLLRPDLESLYMGVQATGSAVVDIFAPYIERSIIGIDNSGDSAGRVTIVGGVIRGANSSTWCVRSMGATSNTYVNWTKLDPGTGINTFYGNAAYSGIFYDTVNGRLQLGQQGIAGLVSPPYQLTLNRGKQEGAAYGFGLGEYVQHIGSASDFQGDWAFQYSGSGNKTARFFGAAGAALSIYTDGQVSAAQRIVSGRVTPTYGTGIGIEGAQGNEFVITATDGAAFTIGAPVSATSGQRITVRIINVSAGALGAVTWNGVFKMAAWTQPAAGFSRAIDFQYNGTNWIEASRTPADVPN